MFLFDRLPGGQWGVVVGVLVGWFVAHRLLKQRRRREQLRRRRQIRARLHAAPPPVDDRPAAPVVDVPVVDVPVVDARPPAPVAGTRPRAPDGDARPPAAGPPVREIDLTEPGVEIDLRDGVVYGSEITLESGDTLETGTVGSLPPD